MNKTGYLLFISSEQVNIGNNLMFIGDETCGAM